MAIKMSKSRKTFLVFNYIFLSLTALICLFPIMHVLSLSFSAAPAAAAGRVSIFPVSFTLASYEYVLAKKDFWNAFLISIYRVLLYLPVTLFLTVTAAYSLSKSKEEFKARGLYIYYLLIPMMFGGGLIPWYLVVKNLGLTNSLLALVIPSAVQIFNIILLMNFLREMPQDIEEAAKIDGAGVVTIITKILLPLAKPCIATISLFVIVGQWNEWFNGIILMDNPTKYPLQSYLQSIVAPDSKITVVDTNNLAQLKNISDRTFKAAQIFLAMFPVLAIYPFLQKYFTKGLVMGSVKG